MHAFRCTPLFEALHGATRDYSDGDFAEQSKRVPTNHAEKTTGTCQKKFDKTLRKVKPTKKYVGQMMQNAAAGNAHAELHDDDLSGDYCIKMQGKFSHLPLLKISPVHGAQAVQAKVIGNNDTVTFDYSTRACLCTADS